MKAPPHIASQVHRVTNFRDLISTPFQGKINALCWNRNLTGDFAEIVQKVAAGDNVTILSQEQLQTLRLSEQGQLARDQILNDFELLQEHGAAPSLNVIRSYERDDGFPLLPTDVYSFHVDRSPVPSATFLCTYHGEPSDILPNDQATQKVLIPAIRNALEKLYGGPKEGFETFLSEYFFDLHYQAMPGARPISLGTGHMWRLAIDHPESRVLPCVHRAPQEKAGEHRLMLIC